MTNAFNNNFAIGIDVGGTKIEAALVSPQGEVMNPVRIPTPEDPHILKEALLQIIDDLQSITGAAGIGFSIPGSLDPKTGILRNAPNSPAINNTKFFKELEKNITKPIKLENDANCLILSEYYFGSAKGSENAVGLIMGTGFGSGVIDKGQLLTGTQGLAPELGHTVINFNGRPCHCGKRGCIEAYLSGPSILSRYFDAGGMSPITNTKEIFDLEKTDNTAKAIIDETKEIFSLVIGNIVSLYNPGVIVLGGGLSLQKMYYKCDMRIKDFIFGSKQVPPIKPALHGDASGKLGAAALFF